MVQLLDADNGSALREPVAAHKGTLLALSDHQFALFAFMALHAGGFRRRFRRQDIALLVQLKSCFAVWIVAASEKRAESAVLMYHRLVAYRAFMFAYLLFHHFAVFVTGTGECALRVR